MPDIEVTVESLTKEKIALENLVREMDSKLKVYEELGEPEKISEVFDKTEEMMTRMEELGDLDAIEEAMDAATELITRYKELGTPEQIVEDMKESKEFMLKTQSEALSKQYGVSVDVVREMVDVHESVEKAEEMLGKLLPSRTDDPTDDLKVEKTDESKTDDDPVKTRLNLHHKARGL